MNAMYPPDDDNYYGGIIDDLKTAAKWRPILALVQRFEQSLTVASRIQAGIEIAEFVARVGCGVEAPRTKRWSKLARRFAVEISIDPDLRDLVKDLLK